MRSLIVASALLLAVCQVEAIFRPAGYKRHPPPSSYHNKGEDCETEKPTTTTTTTTTPSTTTKQLTCPSEFKLFYRTPTARNSFTSAWCLRAVVTRDPIRAGDGNILCSSVDAVLSAPESQEENDFLSARLLVHVQGYNRTSGAIAIDGRRINECISRNRTVLDSLPCSDKSKSFVLQDKHTSDEFMWSNWAEDEPTANAWTYDIEECTQLAVIPSNPKRHNRLNDIYCNIRKAPNDPDYTLYWNFGAVCGKAPE